MDDPAGGGAGAFHDRLGERRVRVHRAGDLLEAALELLRDDQLGDHLGRARADDVRAEQLAVARVADDLHHALAVAVDGRRADAAHRELARPRRRAPRSRASASVRPKLATCGEQNVAPGMSS